MTTRELRRLGTLLEKFQREHVTRDSQRDVLDVLALVADIERKRL